MRPYVDLESIGRHELDTSSTIVHASDLLATIISVMGLRSVDNL